MSKIDKLLDEAARANGTGNVKNAIARIIEAIKLNEFSDENGLKSRRVFTMKDLIVAEPNDPDFRPVQNAMTVQEAVAEARKTATSEVAETEKRVAPIKKRRKRTEERPTVLNKNGEVRKKPGPKSKKLEESNE